MVFAYFETSTVRRDNISMAFLALVANGVFCRNK